MSGGLQVAVDGIIYRLQSQGGISRLFKETLPCMCNLDSALRITLFTEGMLRQSLPEHGHIIHRVIPTLETYLRPGRVWKPTIPSAQRLVRKLRTGRGDGWIWHSTYYTQPESWKGLQVVTVPDMIHERFPELFREPRHERFRDRKRRCVREADAVLCISETTRQDVLRFYELDSARMGVIPLGYSDVFRQLEINAYEPDQPAGQPFLLYIGKRNPYKNFDGLIQAYSVWPCRTDVPLVIVGIPWSVDEERRLVKLGIRNLVHLFTDVDDMKLCRLYNQSAAFVYPSLYEGFGIPLLESMACGCPIVASRIPSTIEVAGECPIYFDPADVESFLAALDKALDKGRDSARVRAGLEKVKDYSWNKTAAKTLEVYRSLSDAE